MAGAFLPSNLFNVDEPIPPHGVIGYLVSCPTLSPLQSTLQQIMKCTKQKLDDVINIHDR